MRGKLPPKPSSFPLKRTPGPPPPLPTASLVSLAMPLPELPPKQKFLDRTLPLDKKIDGGSFTCLFEHIYMYMYVCMYLCVCTYGCEGVVFLPLAACVYTIVGALLTYMLAWGMMSGDRNSQLHSSFLPREIEFLRLLLK